MRKDEENIMDIITMRQIVDDTIVALGRVAAALKDQSGGVIHTPFGDYDPSAPNAVPEPAVPGAIPMPDKLYIRDKSAIYDQNIYGQNGWRTPELYAAAIKTNWDLWKMGTPEALAEPAAFYADWPQYF
jgi:hypothetical protein